MPGVDHPIAKLPCPSCGFLTIDEPNYRSRR